VCQLASTDSILASARYPNDARRARFVAAPLFDTEDEAMDALFGATMTPKGHEKLTVTAEDMVERVLLLRGIDKCAKGYVKP
jgi:hypothetical protein